MASNPLRRYLFLSKRCTIPPFSSPSSRILLTKDRSYSNTTKPQRAAPSKPLDIKALLSTPSWSVSSLLPPQSSIPADFPVTPEKLRHLLRLSALPEPKDVAEEAEMMQTLASQLHFVKEIQKVDTTGVEPLRAIRDETAEAAQDAEITIESLKEAFGKEEVLGKHYRRIRRKQEKIVDTETPQDWQPLAHAQRTVGKYFVVDRKQVSGAE
jgi:Asp-tRNA(Asn)/Glu-tRNA(Gln) amidotransferase C subunit